MSPSDARTSVRAVPVREPAIVEPKRSERAPETERGSETTLAQVAAISRGAEVSPEAIRPDAVLTLQARVGNAAVVSLLRPMAARRASSLVQRRVVMAKRRVGANARPAPIAQRAPTATVDAPAKGPTEAEDVDTSEFTDDPKAAAAKLAADPTPTRPIPPPPSLPAPVAKPPVLKKAGGPTKFAPLAPKASGPPKKSGAKPTRPPVAGEVVKKPAPALPPTYRYSPGAAVPPPPAPPTKMAPGSDPAFKKVMAAAKKTVKATKKHPTGKQQSDVAMAAAKSPQNEQQASAEAMRTGQLEVTAKPKAFNEAAFIDAVMVEIEKTKPKNLQESDQVDNKAEQAKGAIGKQVGVHKEAAAGTVEAEAQQPPKLSDGEKRQEQPLPALQVDKPGGVGASSAMPAPVPNAQVDFRHGPTSVDKEMADADITDKQLADSNEPEFEGALEAKKENEEHAKKAPADLRKAEADILKKATAQTANAEKTAVSGVQTTIGGSTDAIGTSKKTTVDKDEAERKKVADGINGIFTNTQKDVASILTALDTTVDDLFTKAEKSIREAFTYDWQIRLENYKDARYSGIRGKGRWLRDKFKGLPAKAKELFAKSQAMYESMMRKLVKRIASVVSAELTKATNRIKTGREEIVTYVKGLKGEQAKFGAEAAKDISEKFDQLDADVTEKFDEMASAVAKKYSESRTAIDEELKEAWDAEKGLIDKAIDKIKGVYNAIKELKDLFFRVLKKISDVIGTILAHPIKFLQNFFSAVKAGITRFKDNIVDHMKSGLMGWLTGNLGQKGIDIPDSFDLPSMGKLVLSVFGLSWTFLKERLAKKVGMAGMAAIETGASIVGKLKDGPMALWEMVSEKFGEFEDLVLGKIKDFIQNKIVIAGISFLVSMLNPASAFIKACKMIYDVVSFIIDKGKQIGEFVESIIDAAGDIARGGGGGVPEKIEGVLAKALPLAIGFCASLLSLGGIGDKVRDIIEKVRKPIFSAVDRVLDFVVKTTKPIWGPAKRLFEKGTKKGKELYAAGKAKVKAGVDKVKGGAKKAATWVKSKLLPQQVGLAMKGAAHTLKAKPVGERYQLWMASREDILSRKLRGAIDSLKDRLTSEAPPAQARTKHQISQLEEITAIAVRLEKAAGAAGKKAVSASGAPPGFEFEMKKLAERIAGYGQANGVSDITTAAEGTEVDLRLLASFGLPVQNYLQAQQVADRFGAAIDIRPTNKQAGALYAQHANPKSEDFKQKTLDDDDALIGNTAAFTGKVAWFLPQRPPKTKPEEMADATYKRMWLRWRERRNEYYANESKMRKKLRAGQISLIPVGSAGGVLLDALSGVAYTGDHDIFEVHGDAPAVINALKAPPFRVQHGAHVDWPSLPKVLEKGGLDDTERAIFDRIVKSHLPGGKALLRVNPNAAPTTANTRAVGLPVAKSSADVEVVDVGGPTTGFAALEATEKRLEAEAKARLGA